MDTLTHALSGALLGRGVGLSSRLGLRERTLTGLVAAAFPDSDYALFWIDPLAFLNWHRGPTHSLLLLPLWALLLAVILARLMKGGYPWQAFYGICALGIAAHIIGDVITLYGTKIFYPVTDNTFGLGITFDIDPYIAALIALGFVASLVARPQRVVVVTLVVLLGYVTVQTVLYWQTVSVGRAYREQQDLSNAQVYALPQPFSPFTWKVIISHRDRYFVTHLNYLARKEPTLLPQDAWFLRRMIAAYRPPHALQWREHTRFGDTAAIRATARRVWQQERFAAFRQFAEFPVLYRVDYKNGEVCVWFTDLRHNFPALPPSFRYGMCRAGSGEDWRLYRLRYFSVDDRQLLG